MHSPNFENDLLDFLSHLHDEHSKKPNLDMETYQAILKYCAENNLVTLIQKITAVDGENIYFEHTQSAPTDSALDLLRSSKRI